MTPSPLKADEANASAQFDVSENVDEETAKPVTNDTNIERKRISFANLKKSLSTKSKATIGDDGCCDDEACRGHLENANFFLPPGVRASIRSFQNSFVVREEEEENGCCESGACNDHLANANFFLPPGVMPFKAESSRSVSVRRLSVASIRSSGILFADTPNEEDDEPISRIGRSHFTAKGICCSSEIPMVKSILVPIKGVDNVKVSPATKAIYVDHDIDIVSAGDLCHELDKGGFYATTIKDAAVEITQKIGIPSDVKVVSVFDVNVKDGLEEEKISACVMSVLVEDGEKVFKVSQLSSQITVEYNPYYATASNIAKSIDGALEVEESVTTVISDGGADGRWALEAMKHGVQDTIELQESSIAWPVILSGIFCVISFLR